MSLRVFVVTKEAVRTTEVRKKRADKNIEWVDHLAGSQRLAIDIPGADGVVIERCGHLPQEECPDEFMEAVVKFINMRYWGQGGL